MPATCRPGASLSNGCNNNIELLQTPPEPAEVLAKIADAADAGKALDDFSPPHEGYKRLKALLAEMRGKDGGGNPIADGALLKLNPKAPMEDPRVPLLREKLGLGGDAADLKYDAKLAEAVKKFQRANELPVTGNLDAKTIKELNGPPRDQLDRPHHRQHGALALVSARSRQGRMWC